MDALYNFPAMPPPVGMKSNFIDPPTLGPRLAALNAIFLTLMLIVVSGRIYARAIVTHSVGYDDYTCIVAALGSTVHTALVVYCTKLGYGKHLWDIRATSLTPDRILTLSVVAVVYPIVLFFLKLSISLLYLRLFGVRKTFRAIVLIQIAILFVIYAALTGYSISLVVICSSWKAATLSYCTHSKYINLGASVFNLLTDFILLGLPIPIVLKLNLKLKQKIGLLAIFSSGFAASLVSAGRLIYFAKTIKSTDFLYNAAGASFFGLIEMNVGIIAASLSVMPTVIARGKLLFGSTFHSLRSTFFSKNDNRKTSNENSLELGSRKADSNFIPLEG